MRHGLATCLSLLGLVGPSVARAADPPEASDRRYSALDASDLDALAGILRQHVAYLRVTVDPPKDQPLADRQRSGFGAVLDRDLVVALPFFFDGATRVELVGPKGALEGKVVLRDDRRRVAIVRSVRPLAEIGLVPPVRAPAAQRKVDDEVFALVSTRPHTGVIHGVITDLGADQEHEGHPRIDLELSGGMPVFDTRARLLGYSRVVAWDVDRFMIITTERIAAARTATAAPARKDEAKTETKPWWAR